MRKDYTLTIYYDNNDYFIRDNLYQGTACQLASQYSDEYDHVVKAVVTQGTRHVLTIDNAEKQALREKLTKRDYSQLLKD